MAQRKLELRLGAYSIGVNLISLAVAAVFFYHGEIFYGVLAFLFTAIVLLALIYTRTSQPGNS